MSSKQNKIACPYAAECLNNQPITVVAEDGESVITVCAEVNQSRIEETRDLAVPGEAALVLASKYVKCLSASVRVAGIPNCFELKSAQSAAAASSIEQPRDKGKDERVFVIQNVIVPGLNEILHFAVPNRPKTINELERE